MDRTLTKSGNWVSIYLVAVALGLTTLGLVMLFSAGAVRGAQALLTKQFIWLGMSIIVGVYAAFMDLGWLKRRASVVEYKSGKVCQLENKKRQIHDLPWYD